MASFSSSRNDSFKELITFREIIPIKKMIPLEKYDREKRTKSKTVQLRFVCRKTIASLFLGEGTCKVT